jgi:hypothetical protein
MHVKGWQEAVAAESLEIRQRIMARLAHKPSRSFRRNNARVEAAASVGVSESFSWSVRLNPQGPPPAVHVEPRKGLVAGYVVRSGAGDGGP